MDRCTYKKLLRVAGGKERLRAYARTRPQQQRLSDAELAELHQVKTRHYARLIAQHTCRLRPGVETFIGDAIARRQTLAIATRSRLRRWTKAMRFCSATIAH